MENKNLKRITNTIYAAFALLALACFVLSPTTRAETATAVGNCRSIFLDPATGYLPGLGQLRTYISTYDGQPGFPLYQPLPDGSILFSCELRPRNAQTGLYEADFATYDSDSSIQDYGSLTLTIPITDSDQNGLPDIAQRDRPGNAQVHGSVVSDFYGTFSSITGTLSRPANSISGTYFVNITGPNTISYSGSLYLLNVSGTCTYSRTTGTISFALNETLPNGGNQTLSGLTTFEVVDANRITLRQFNLNASGGGTYSVLATTLTRSGNKYRGNLQLADGNPQTYWPDYTSWVVEILDQNDSNHDGIPNLSDPTATPTPTPTATLQNISTRSFVQTSGNVMIGGFIVQGTGPKRVIIRAIGPELTQYGVPNAMANPTLELHDGTGALIGSNDNWQTPIIGGIITGDQVADIQNSGHAPGDARESAIIADLPAGNYTAIVRGGNNTTGVALVEVYDLNRNANSILGNISTRSFVQTGDNVMIGGFIVQGTGPKRVIIRAIGPELTQYGVPNAMANPTLELHDGTGALIGSNDNWQTPIIGGIITGDQVADIQNSGHAPGDARESAIIANLPPGNYTAIVRGWGVALVEVYDLH